MQKLKDKHVFWKTEIINVWYMKSSVSQKKNMWTSVIYAVSRPCFQMCHYENMSMQYTAIFHGWKKKISDEKF